jgi:hypothetical protein
MAMAPNLTADSVIHYLLTGASAQRYDPWVDSLITPSPLAGTSLYQLHSFASLQLYSRTHGDAPICGLEVSLDPTPFVNEATIHRYTPTVVEFSGFGNATHISVAQGGRLLAAGGWDETTEESLVKEYRLQSGTWTHTRTISGVDERHFLERDTLDVTLICPEPGCGPKVTIRRGDGTSTTRELPTLGAINESAEDISMDGFAASPAGDWISFTVQGHIEDDDHFRKLMVYHIGSQTAGTFRRWEWTMTPEPFGQDVTVVDSMPVHGLWSRVGERLLSAHTRWSIHYPPNPGSPDFTDAKAIYLPISVASGTPTAGSLTTVAERWPYEHGYFSTDDRTVMLVEEELDFSEQYAVRRNATALGTILGSSTWNWGTDRHRGYFPIGQLREEGATRVRSVMERAREIPTTLMEYRARWRRSHSGRPAMH